MYGADSTQRIGVLFALPEESAPFLRRFRPKERRVVVGVSGVGRKKAAAAAERMLEAQEVNGLLICGFAGGLEGLPGDLILAEKVIAWANGRRMAEMTPNARMLEQMRDFIRAGGWEALWKEGPWNPDLHTGTLVTADKVLVTSAEKRRLKEETGAVAVDMETAGAALAAAERGIPWMAIRAVTDGPNDTLPLDFNALADAEGDVDRKRILRATLTHPWKIPALIRLGQRSTLAARNLAIFLETFLKSLPE